MSYHVRWNTYAIGGDKAEGRRQKAEGKEEGCKAQRNNDCLGGHDINKTSSLEILISLKALLSRV
jgi:hypothetical protein